MDSLVLNAPAKINLALQVQKLRADGFHELKMIMQSISLADKIKLSKSSEGISLSSSSNELPLDNSNLAFKAAESFFSANQVEGGVEIYLEKNIPIAAGLAGGSADAAAVMRGLYKLFELEEQTAKVKSLLAQLGSDIPYCLHGGTVYATGRGEVLEQLPELDKKHLLVVTPAVKLATPTVYKQYDNLAAESEFNFEAILKNLKFEEKVNWSLDYKNDLQPAAESLCPQIKEVEELLKESGAEFTLLSGSGPSVFAVYPLAKQAEQAAKNWPRKTDFITAAETISSY